ncbi:MAG: helix-turn-helix transcriptional regulator [Lachnospiraceae bacterium]|nr:helix-turn-helix transcriptional regulator [Lachnospiraceae bacterium]
MNEVFIGEYIRQRRKELHLTQAQLCEGICEPLAISRMERGVQTPQSATLNALLERLGLPGERCYALISKQEKKRNDLQKEIVSLNVQYETALEKDRPEYLRHAYDRLHELEEIIDNNDRLSRQFILRSRVLLGREDGTAYTFEEQLDLLLQAIRLTVPRFDLDNINSFLYCLDEVKVINQIAGVYSDMGQNPKAAEILSQLLRYIENHFPNIQQSGGHLPLITYNYSLCLLKCGHYEEMLEIAEKGKAACVKFGHYQNLPGLLHCMAIACHYTADDTRSRELFRQAYYLYMAIDNPRFASQLQNDARKLFGSDFTF